MIKRLAVPALLLGQNRASLSFALAMVAHAYVFTLDPQGTVRTKTSVAPHKETIQLELTPLVANELGVAAEAGLLQAKAIAPKAVNSSAARPTERAMRQESASRMPPVAASNERALAPEALVASDPPPAEVVQQGSPSIAAASQVSGTAEDRLGVTGVTAGRGPSTSGNRARGTPSGASLLTAGDLCAGYFPAASPVARGTVQVRVDVDARGVVTRSSVLVATPAGGGFSQAALACASRLRFAPAKTGDGNTVPSRAVLSLNFERP